MGKDEETLVVEAADDGIGDLFDGDGAGFEEAIFFAVVTEEHAGAHALGTDAGDFDAGVAMFDRDPFGEGEGGVFGDGVGGGADLGEESGGGDDLEEVAVAAGEHVGEDGAGGVEMGAEVDGEDALPVYIGGIEASGEEDAGVGAE